MSMWRLPTGALGTRPAAGGEDAAGLQAAWWTATGDAIGGLTTSSSKSSSARTECTMEFSLLLQRGHSGLLSAHRWMQGKQKRWQHGIT